MPDEEKKKYNPKDLYATPEFPEDQGTREVFAEPEKKGGRLVAIITASALVLALAVLVLTGVIPMPSPTSGGTGAGITPSAGQPVVSEIMSDNKKTLAAPNGKYYDWVEIYNPTGQPIDLSGYRLSDNANKPDKFILPSASIPAKGFVIVYASGKDALAGVPQAPFKLSASGTVVFSDASGTRIQQIEYPKLQGDESFALNLSNLTSWAVTANPSPGNANP